MDIEQLLKESDLFKEMNEISIKEIAGLGRLRSLPANHSLFYEGEEGTSFYLLGEGAVKLFKIGPEGQEIMVRLVKPGDYFAEVILFENDRYPVSAVTVAASRVFVLQKEPLLRLLADAPFRREFIAGLMKKMRYLAARIVYLTAFSVEDRFFRFLLDRYGKGDRYDINLSKKDIASAIGTIPETLSRLILRLKKRGVITWEKNILTMKAGFWEENASLYDED
jgi:CRP-like cAMP-binding protein